MFLDYILDKDNWKYPPTVVGRREMISIPEIGDLEAKFDTGNMVVNSIHADSYEVRDGIVYWEMDGEEYENELLDILTVLQGAVAANKEQRPMIELDIEFMGKKYPKRKFTLDDRSNKGTPVLIGVPFMKEFHIIVDPGKKFIKTERIEEQKLTKQEIKLRDKYAKSLKKRAKGFKSRYGDDYMDVIFGTATNMAKRSTEEEAADQEYHKGTLEGTPERTRKYKQMTPGQVNEVADTYFNKGGSI
jgi:hypothetical protein